MIRPSMQSPRLREARELIREKGLSSQDLSLLGEIFQVAEGDLKPLVEGRDEGVPIASSLARLHRDLGMFIAFLHIFSEKRLGEARGAMGLVLQHSLATLEERALAAHQEDMLVHQDAPWIVELLDTIAALRILPPTEGDGTNDLGLQWNAFMHERRAGLRDILARLGTQGEDGAALVRTLQNQMKTVNRSLQVGAGNRPLAAINKLRDLLESAVPADIRRRAEPLLLVRHVLANLRHSLLRPLDRGVHWPAVEQMRGSLQWLWNHLGWTMPRLHDAILRRALPPDVRSILKTLRTEHPPAFLIIARALASHLALLSLVEGLEPAGGISTQNRYASVPTFIVVEAELGRLAEGVYHPKAAETLPKGSEDALLLGAFLRQAILALLQDQSTVRNLLQQALAGGDADQLAHTLDNMRALLVNHQRQLMGDLVGLFSSELRKKLFPDSPSLTEEGDRLRQRLHRLWEGLSPLAGQIRIHLELTDWTRLALTLALAQAQVSSFRRSPEFFLIRAQDRSEFDRLTLSLSRIFDNPPQVEAALTEGTELINDLMKFLELYLLRINSRIPLIRHDLRGALESARLTRQLQVAPRDLADRNRLAHRLIQTTKRLGVRDPQALALLKKWVRQERSTRDVSAPLEALASHLDRLAHRLEAALG